MQFLRNMRANLNSRSHLAVISQPRRCVPCQICFASLSAQPQTSGLPTHQPLGLALEQPTSVASIDVGDAIEKLSVPLQSARSSLLTITLSLPMGMVVEESEGLFVVVEVTPGSSAAQNNVQEGDVLRAVTIASMQMTYPTINLMLGGVGRPKVKRIAAPVSGRSFAWLREAINSNNQLPGNSITVVLERPAKGTGPCRFDGSEEVAGVPCSKGLFDPRIFE